MATTVDSLRKAIGKKKQSQAFAWLADLMRLSGDLDGALQCVRSGLQDFPESVEGHLVLSKILEEKQDLDGVVEACEAVLSRNPYCLSALRRLGDVFATKGDKGNRNYYYQLLHDLDPLDPFWKEEYAPQIDMASMAQDMTLGAAGVATAATAEQPSLDEILKDEPLDLGGESLFEKASETIAPKAADEASVAVEESPVAEAPADETAAEESQTSEDDPFSALASLIPADEEKDAEVSFDDLEHSLDDAIAGFAPTDTTKDQFPMDEIDGNDVNSALTGIFGASEMEESAPTAPAVKEAPAVEEKAQSLSDAFDDIFGEDELPEEFVPSKPAAPVAEASPAVAEAPTAEPVAEENPATGDVLNLDEALPTLEAASATKTEESLETSVESSFDTLFGKDDDDLPLEGGFEKSSSADVELPKADSSAVAEAPSAEPVAEENPATGDVLNLDEALPTLDAASATKTEESLETSVESSFDTLFGKDDDDLPLEGGFEKSSSADEELPKAASPADAEAPTAEPVAEENLETSVESSFDNLFGKDSDDELSLDELKLDEDVPAVEGSVNSSFDSIFGKDSDDALLEDPTTSTRTLAEIYFGQGVYDEAIKIYKDLLRKDSDNAELKQRLAEIEKIRDNKNLN